MSHVKGDRYARESTVGQTLPWLEASSAALLSPQLHTCLQKPLVYLVYAGSPRRCHQSGRWEGYSFDTRTMAAVQKKAKGLRCEPPPFEPRKAGPACRQLHVQVLWTQRQSGTGHLAPLWEPRGAVGTARCCETQSGSYFSTSMSWGWLEQRVQTSQGHSNKMQLAVCISKTVFPESS